MKQEVITYVLGDVRPSELIACILFGFLGIFTHTIWKALKRNPLTEYSPIHFSVKYFISDNFERFLLSLLLTLVGIPLLVFFSEKIFDQSMSPYFGLLIGFGFDNYMKELMDATPYSGELTNLLEKKEEMEFWDLKFNDSGDLVETATGNVSLSSFAGQTKGTLSAATITYLSQPLFDSVNAIGRDGKVYVATPTRRPV